MKTTMKSHEYLNKKIKGVRKITRQLVMALLVFVVASCEKEELLEPDQKVQEVDKAIKATSRIVPNLSLEIGFWGIRAPYDRILENRTVRFNGSFLSASSTIIDGGRVSNQIWSSYNGRSWSLRSNDPFRIGVTNMVVHNNKVWALGTWGELGPLEAYTSSDGHTWSRVKSSLPFSDDSEFDVVVFNNKIFVFENDFRAKGIKVYSSFDGINWTLETADAFPKRRGGTAIVFKNTLYYMGGATEGSGISNEIWQSTNGRYWSQVSGATPNYLNPGENFPAKSDHAAVVHDNAIWVTGGIGIKGNTAQGKDIWVSRDMKNWIKYTGHVPFNPHVRATLLSYNDRILLLGGYSIPESGVSVKSKTIWSIKPKSTPWIPKITRK